jgi:hypothetical protein
MTAPTPDELMAAGWTPPATVGGTWCRVSPEGIYEIWPRRPETTVEIVHSDSMTYLKDPAAFQKPTTPLGHNLLAMLGTTTMGI